MTREKTKKAIDVMLAYVNGEKIQVKNKNEKEWKDWEKDFYPTWNYEYFDYRIKPEKRVRPYTFEEMCDAVKMHGLIVKVKSQNVIYVIGAFDENNILYKDGVYGTYEEFLNEYIWFDDNSQCGIEEE